MPSATSRPTAVPPRSAGPSITTTPRRRPGRALPRPRPAGGVSCRQPTAPAAGVPRDADDAAARMLRNRPALVIPRVALTERCSMIGDMRTFLQRRNILLPCRLRPFFAVGVADVEEHPLQELQKA